MGQTAERQEPHHGVQFYESDETLFQSIAGYLAHGLQTGPAVVIATPTHRAGFARQLRATGVDLDRHLASGRIVFLDAEETLEQFMFDGSPDWQRFTLCIGEVLERVTKRTGSSRICAYGEMVDVLWRAGKADAALQLEEMWCELATIHDFDLVCAYETTQFQTNPHQLSHVCDRHGDVLVLPSPEPEASGTHDLRAIAAEIGRRKSVETQLRHALRELEVSEEKARIRAERISRLQRATARLAAEIDQPAVVDTIVTVASELFEATSIAVYLFDRENALRLEGARGDDAENRLPTLALDSKLQLVHAIASRQSIWLNAMAAVPLLHGTLLIGGLEISFADEHPFEESEREAIEGFAQQAALAIDRARLYAAQQTARADARNAIEEQRQLVVDLKETLHLNELFTGVLAHDLRNPLGAVMTAAQLLILRAEKESNGDAKHANRILASARRMARMIDQLLDFTRVRVGAGLQLEVKQCDLEVMLAQVVDELRTSRPECAIAVKVDGDLRGSWDDDRLGQVFSNLIANAVQHGDPKHGVAVRVDGRDLESITVEIHNHGVIPRELLPKLFAPMVGSERRRDGSRGLGLGLFITHAITNRHGGTIRVTSSEQDGTRFTVTLPRHVVQEPVVDKPTSRTSPSLWRERFLIDTIRDYAIFLLDTEGHVQSWNTGAQLTKGYRADEIIGRHISAFYPPEDRRRGAPQQLLRRALEEGHVEDEAWRIRKDGTRFWANVVLTALRDENGVHTGFAKVTRDLTERKRLEEDRLRLAEANEGIRLRDEFLSIVSHELKTPLTGLQLQLDLLAENLASSEPRVVERLRRASTSSERITHLIESLLDVSRIATGRFVLSLEQIDMVGLVVDTVETFRAAAGRSGTSIEVIGKGPILGNWDRVRLAQVITNLLSNAVKYGVGKPIDVKIESDNEEVSIVVRDHGPGIAIEDRERIFGRFERASSTRHFGGLGIGLYVVREIVTAHGGTVLASNAPDGGACFTVTLPRELAMHHDGSGMREEEPTEQVSERN